MESVMMELEVDEKDLKAAGAEPLTDGRRGLVIHGWEIESRKGAILNSSTVQEYSHIFSYFNYLYYFLMHIFIQFQTSKLMELA